MERKRSLWRFGAVLVLGLLPMVVTAVPATAVSLTIEVNYSSDWVSGSTDPFATVAVYLFGATGDLEADAVVVAEETGVFFVGPDDWFSGTSPSIDPGDAVVVDVVVVDVVVASAAVDSVGWLSGVPDEDADTVSLGQVHAPGVTGSVDVRCSVWEEGAAPNVDTSADADGGAFTCDFGAAGWDLQRFETVAVSYYEPEGDQVIHIMPWPRATVDQSADTVGGVHAARATVSVVVEDGLGSSRGSAEAVTDYDGWFSVGPSDWSTQLDIVPGDSITVSGPGRSWWIEVGEITGTIDVASDRVTGTIAAPGVSPAGLVDVHCVALDGATGEPANSAGVFQIEVRDEDVDPSGGAYTCDWSDVLDPWTAFDLTPEHDVWVRYEEPDGDEVAVRLSGDWAGDQDGDGVPDADDLCPATVLPESIPTVELKVNRYADIDGDGTLETGPSWSPVYVPPTYTITDTGGCSAEQIIDQMGLGGGHTKFGLSEDALNSWIAAIEP